RPSSLIISQITPDGNAPLNFAKSTDASVLTRPGHTEASVDLAKLSGAFPSGVICEIIKDDGRMARVPDLMDMAQQFDLKLISIEDLIRYRKQKEVLITREVETVLPT